MNPKLLHALQQDKTSDHAKAAWDILGAMRGPDEHKKGDLKAQYTVHIRAWAFPEYVETATMHGSIVGQVPTVDEVKEWWEPLSSPDLRYSSHFLTHIEGALRGIFYLETGEWIDNEGEPRVD